MKCVNIVTFIICIHASSQFVSVNLKQPKSHCDSTAKNSLIEHFFNTIFTEFHNTPPVCVCVQMCVGQSTYCYPNGCLKQDDLKRVDSPQATAHARPDKKQYMFVVDEKNDFLKDFFERTEDEVTVAPVSEPIRYMLPELFKDKYRMLVKYKKMPSVELRYNLREQVKNMKSDLLKIETVDVSKTRWPMNKRNLVSGHSIRSKKEKKTPLIGKTNFFMTMLPADEVADYPPKYFKREIAKTVNDNEAKVKAFYLFENFENITESNVVEPISLETLINNLVNNSFKTKHNNKKNETQYNIVNENIVVMNKSKEAKKRTSDLINMKETMNVISVNLTNETDDKNKYMDDFVPPSANKFNEMIINLSKRIEKQNNTSMEIAKRIFGNFKEEVTTLITSTETLKGQFSSFTEHEAQVDKTKTVNQETTSTTSGDFKHTMVTMKNRQRRARKSQNSKINIQ